MKLKFPDPMCPIHDFLNLILEAMGNLLSSSSTTVESHPPGNEDESLLVIQENETAVPPLSESPSVVEIPSCNLRCVRFSAESIQGSQCKPSPLRHVNKLASFPSESCEAMKVIQSQQREQLRKSLSLDSFHARERKWECSSPLCHVDLSPRPHGIHEEKED